MIDGLLLFAGFGRDRVASDAEHRCGGENDVGTDVGRGVVRGEGLR